VVVVGGTVLVDDEGVVLEHAVESSRFEEVESVE